MFLRDSDSVFGLWRMRSRTGSTRVALCLITLTPSCLTLLISLSPQPRKWAWDMAYCLATLGNFESNSLRVKLGITSTSIGFCSLEYFWKIFMKSVGVKL